MKSSAQQIRSYKGPAILSFGFRPFFLVAGTWTVLSLALSTAMLANLLMLPIAFEKVDWHVHEQLYGYLPAVIAGFMLTAVPNWTGRLPVTGMPLLSLVLVWLIGRLAMCKSAFLGVMPTAFLDVSFLLYFAFVIGREVVSGKNWKNLKVLILIGVMAAGNAIFHYEAAEFGVAANGYGVRIGLAVAITLIMVIGGRIVPSFTRNWLARRVSESQLPVPFNRFDIIAMVIGVAALIVWCFLPFHEATAYLCVVAGGVQALRLARWAGHLTLSEPLVLVLHVGYAFVPLGFVLIGLASLLPYSITPNAAVHAWTAGAVGVMTLAVMTRASLGHSGKPLTANFTTTCAYSLIVLATLLRVASGIADAPDWSIELAAAAWVMGFGLFLTNYGPLLVRSRSAQV
ncbi:MAG: NnrS family protein [Rhodobacteraceae bacterium]|nr:NnrS family protein [Paracoccaceae bacterium]